MLKSVLIDRAFYIQENTRAQDDVVVRNIQPVISELKRLLILEPLEEFHGIYGYRHLKSEYRTD